MDIQKHWPEILAVLASAKRSSLHFAIATVTPEGNPHVTPIGHVFFRADLTGFYFDAYSSAMPKNFAGNRRICLMGVNSSPRFWLTALFKGQFSAAPGVRLFGEVGDPRAATPAEIEQLARSIHATRALKGHKLIWSNLHTVRDIRFDGFAPVQYPSMCEGHWRA